MIPTRISPAVLVLFLAQASHAFYWGFYLPCAQPQLAANAPAACDSAIAGVDCLCADATFLTASMKDIRRNCGCAVLEDSAQKATTICNNAGAPIALTEDQMVSAGDGGLSSCTDPSGVSSTTASTDAAGSGSGGSNDQSSRSGLSRSDQIAIGIGVPTGVATVVGAIAGIVKCMRSRHS